MINPGHLQQLISNYYLEKYMNQAINDFGQDLHEEVKSSKQAIHDELIDILNKMLTIAAANGQVHISVEGLSEGQRQLLLQQFENIVGGAVEQGLRSVIDQITNDAISNLRRQGRQRQLTPLEQDAITFRENIPGVPDFLQHRQNMYAYCVEVARHYVSNISLNINTPPKIRPG